MIVAHRPALALTQLLRDRWSRESTFVVPLTVAVFLSALANFAMGPFLPAMGRDLGAPVAVLGQLPAAAALAVGVLGFVVGPVADRLGHRRALILALAALACSGVGIALAPGADVLLLALLVGALGRAAIPPISQALVGDRLVDHARRRALGWTTAGTSGAVVVGVPALTSIDAFAGWRVAFAFTALLAVGAAFLVVRLLGAAGPRPTANWSVRNALASYEPIVRHRPTLGLIGSSTLGVAGTGTVLTYLGAYLSQQHDLATREIGWVYLAVGAGALAGSLAAGGRLGARPLRPLLVVARALLGLLAGGAFLLPLPPILIAAALTLALVLVAVSTVATAALLTGETPGSRATTAALNSSGANIGTALGASVGGICLGIGGFTLLAVACALWYAASAAVVWWSRPDR
ncbi:MAG: MFS transporter [Chloroflexota bacterium]|nr:MAG: MFS transporter [Chloroflexota bacterium]